jgi:hypothetical protein
LILAGKTTLEEVERHWTLADVARVNRALDLEEAIREAADRARNKK